MNRRTLLLSAVLLSLGCCLLVSFGVADETRYAGRLDLTAPSFDQLRRRFTTRLAANQIHLVSAQESGCGLTPDRLTVPEDETCIYAIQPDSAKTRQLSLVLGGEGQSVWLSLTQPNAISVDQTLKAGQSIDLDIYKNDQNQGAELSFDRCEVEKLEEQNDLLQPYLCALEIQK